MGGPEVLLAEYFAYHQRRRPGQEQELVNGYEILEAKMVDVDQIRFEAWGIPYGFAIALKDHVKRFLKQRKIDLEARDSRDEALHQDTASSNEDWMWEGWSKRR